MLTEGVLGDFRHDLGAVPAGGRRLFAFLGGTIGNQAPADRRTFLTALTATMAPGDSLLLGTDLVKQRLIAAYDDAAGVTAEFDRNVLAVLNRELGGTPGGRTATSSRPTPAWAFAGARLAS